MRGEIEWMSVNTFKCGNIGLQGKRTQQIDGNIDLGQQLVP
jgi:hypothetical protein